MDKVNCFKTRDGKIFENEAEALQHDKFLAFHNNYIGDPILDERGMAVPSETIFNFLTENIGWVKNILDCVDSVNVLVKKNIDLDVIIKDQVPVIFKGEKWTLSVTNRGTIRPDPLQPEQSLES